MSTHLVETNFPFSRPVNFHRAPMGTQFSESALVSCMNDKDTEASLAVIEFILKTQANLNFYVNINERKLHTNPRFELDESSTQRQRTTEADTVHTFIPPVIAGSWSHLPLV